ncbi:unnamed protein product [Brassica oleracea var. botrytis]|uniref:BnaC05g05140D protein n=2 Tax=Brassica TaxID=3705 RepID=A0A078FA58_BRANA|nr:BnaC05g05140D [Brassica napus]VDD41767.1 unnamed protein product [Brassica oleracea]
MLELRLVQGSLLKKVLESPWIPATWRSSLSCSDPKASSTTCATGTSPWG